MLELERPIFETTKKPKIGSMNGSDQKTGNSSEAEFNSSPQKWEKIVAAEGKYFWLYYNCDKCWESEKERKKKLEKSTYEFHEELQYRFRSWNALLTKGRVASRSRAKESLATFPRRVRKRPPLILAGRDQRAVARVTRCGFCLREEEETFTTRGKSTIRRTSRRIVPCSAAIKAMPGIDFR